MNRSPLYFTPKIDEFQLFWYGLYGNDILKLENKKSLKQWTTKIKVIHYYIGPILILDVLSSAKYFNTLISKSNLYVYF